MTNQPFRFLHAADLHLELPINGLTDAPEHLRERILDAPRRAAQRLFDAALTEKVDFVILSGDLLSTQMTGPWGPIFLVEQFEKLRMEGIPVYWACGKADEPEDWPEALPLPDNVHLFPVGEIEETVFTRDSLPVARILGTSLGKIPTVIRESDFSADPDGLYSIGVLYGKPHLETLKATGMQYWALGGDHRRDTLARTPAVIHYPGATLCRNPRENGDAGATLVEVNEFGRTIFQPLKTSPIQWSAERVVIRGDFNEEALLAEMRARVISLRKTLGDILHFIHWEFDVPASALPEFRYGNLTTALLRDLRSDFGKEPPIVWSLDAEPVLPDTPDPDVADQQTILGDFLRMVHFYQENPNEKIELSDYFSEELADYLATEYLAAKRLHKIPDEAKERESEVDADGGGNDQHDESAAEQKSFRGEVPQLIRLLTLSADERTGYRKKITADSADPADRETCQKLADRRIAALREAAALGMEILAGEQEETHLTTKEPIRKNPKLAEERRHVAEYLDGKEARQ